MVTSQSDGESVAVVKISRTCIKCASERIIEAPVKGLAEWSHGGLIQDAMPDLSAEDREMLISGICPSCWEEMI